jgi:hypothetical protein
MDNRPDKDVLFNPEDLRAFLLGGLPQRATEWMEEKLITDEAFFREVQAAEEELIDEYVLDGLTDAEKEHLLQRFGWQPEWTRRVALRKAFFATLHRGTGQRAERVSAYRADEVSKPSRWFRLLMPCLAAAVGLLLILCGLLLRESHELKSSLAQAELARRAAPSMPTQAPPAEASVAEVFFPLHAVRGISHPAALRFSRTPQRPVELQIQIPPGLPNAERWNVTIRDEHGNLIVQNGCGAQLVGSVAFVKVSLSSATLAPGTYDVQLSPARPATEAYINHWALQVEP